MKKAQGGAMKRKRTVIVGWKAIMLAPVALPIAILAGLFARPARRTPTEIVGLIEGFLEGDENWEWDELECVPLADAELEAIRRRAVRMGPPNANEAALRELVDEIKQRYSLKER